ncbi:hypothetical protein C1646_771146 [Rhizophagus diaphanus]|nr:hypothetical protein C1646_771146 [Rhizophagus diaphanus] [Rhizophagus sp. MUCL 43196]
MKLVNQYDIIPFNSIAGLIHMILRNSKAIYGIFKDPHPKKFTDAVDDPAENLQQNPIDDDEIIGDEDIITFEHWKNELAEWESILIEKEVF